MKKLSLLVGLMGVLAVTNVQAAFDGALGITGTAGRIGTGGGGPFDLTKDTDGIPPYAPTVAFNQVFSQGNTFISFCVERNEYIDLSGNQGYRAVVNSAAVGGGVGGGSPDPICLATAWLYSTFRASGSTGLDALFIANETGANNAVKINKGRDSLQQAIWFLEAEVGGAGSGAYLVTAASSALGATYLNNAGGAYGVRVLNLYSDDGLTQKNQDMLAMVPEPTTIIAGALLLLPFGASTIRFIRKNRAA
jgi:hypothetical protein